MIFKKSKKRIALAVAALGFVGVSSVVVGVAAFAENVSPELTTTTVDFSDTYYRGDLFEIPEMEFTLGDTTVVAETEVESPSGKKFTSKQFYLDSRGEYTVKYSAVIDGKYYYKNEKFEADLKLFETSAGEKEVESSVNPYYESAEGKLVTLSYGGTFYYNKEIDLSKLGTKNLINFYVIPEVRGVEDIETIYIQLTDKYDENNNVVFKATYSAVAFGFPAVFWQAGNEDMGILGIDQWSGNISSPWTGCVQSSFCAIDRYAKPGQNYSVCNISLNYDTKVVSAANNSTTIIDLDNKEHFDAPWEGFTTGECYLSMWADGYKSTSPAKILITSIANESLNQMENTTIEDESAPVIDIDFEGCSQKDIPVGLVGELYPIFKAKALDYGAQILEYPYEIQAFMNYEKYGEKYPVPVLPNGYLLPNNAGEVTVIYKAKDLDGNASSATYSFTVKNNMDDISLSYNGETICSAGELLDLTDYTLQGVSGDAQIKVYLEENGSLKLLENALLRPAHEGRLNIVYEISDYLNRTKEERITIEVVGSTGYFETLPILPRYFMNGVAYNLGSALAWDYTSPDGVQAVSAKIRVLDAAGERFLESYTYIPTVTTTGETVQVSYVLDLADGSQIESKAVEIPVITTRSGNNNQVIEMENYFWSENESVSTFAGEKSVSITTSEDATVDFVKSLLALEFQINFSIDEGSAFDKITFCLTDSEDSSIQLNLSIFKAIVRHEGKNVEKTVLSLGTKKYKLSQSIDGGEEDFQLTYKNNNFEVKEKSTSKIVAKFDANGNAFAGFPSNKVYLSIEMEVSGESTLQVKSINSQTFNNLSMDLMLPVIQIPKGYGGNYSIGDFALLNYAVAGDVLSEVATFALTVRAPSGDIVRSTEGVLLNSVDPSQSYTIQFTQNGFYSVEYKAVDTAGRSATLIYGLTITDVIAPIILLEEKIPASAKIGQKITIPTAMGIDNIDGECDVYVIVIAPDLSRRSVKQDTFTFTKVGEYQFIYMCMDVDGNVSMQTYRVSVV